MSSRPSSVLNYHPAKHRNSVVGELCCYIAALTRTPGIVFTRDRRKARIGFWEGFIVRRITLHPNLYRLSAITMHTTGLCQNEFRRPSHTVEAP